MNSLMNYGSDDDYDDSSEEKQTDWRGTSSRDKQTSTNCQTDANYEEVQMDLSEGSNDSKPETRESSSSNRRSRERGGDTVKDRRERERERDRDSKERDRSRYEKERKNSRDKDSGSKSQRSDYQGRRERDRDRDNRERKSRRSTSRERRRSRSPRRERETRHSRSRSRSRERNRKYSKRYDRGGGKSQLEKNDPQKSADDEKRTNPTESDRFFMPGITGRFRDQIERRKQLWQKKDATTDPKDNKNGQQGKKVWEATTFAQDTDGKVANKFKRLMGIRGNTEGQGQGGDGGGLRKQEEMFSSMEQQYEVARTATHTMRGVGLGFGSFQR